MDGKTLDEARAVQCTSRGLPACSKCSSSSPGFTSVAPAVVFTASRSAISLTSVLAESAAAATRLEERRVEIRLAAATHEEANAELGSAVLDLPPLPLPSLDADRTALAEISATVSPTD